LGASGLCVSIQTPKALLTQNGSSKVRNICTSKKYFEI
jgi:hypothetical protein